MHFWSPPRSSCVGSAVWRVAGAFFANKFVNSIVSQRCHLWTWCLFLSRMATHCPGLVCAQQLGNQIGPPRSRVVNEWPGGFHSSNRVNWWHQNKKKHFPAYRKCVVFSDSHLSILWGLRKEHPVSHPWVQKLGRGGLFEKCKELKLGTVWWGTFGCFFSWVTQLNCKLPQR